MKAWKRQRIVNLTKNEEDKHIRAFKTKQREEERNKKVKIPDSAMEKFVRSGWIDEYASEDPLSLVIFRVDQ